MAQAKETVRSFRCLLLAPDTDAACAFEGQHMIYGEKHALPRLTSAGWVPAMLMLEAVISCGDGGLLQLGSAGVSSPWRHPSSASVWPRRAMTGSTLILTLSFNVSFTRKPSDGSMTACSGANDMKP